MFFHDYFCHQVVSSTDIKCYKTDDHNKYRTFDFHSIGPLPVDPAEAWYLSKAGQTTAHEKLRRDFWIESTPKIFREPLNSSNPLQTPSASRTPCSWQSPVCKRAMMMAPLCFKNSLLLHTLHIAALLSLSSHRHIIQDWIQNVPTCPMADQQFMESEIFLMFIPPF